MNDLRVEKGKKTKEIILLAALDILFQEGRGGLTSRKLAEKASVSKGNIYHHFKNMEEILEEAFKYDLEKSTFAMLDFEFNDLDSLIENFVINIIKVFEKKKEICVTSHDPFLELVSTNKNFLQIIEKLERNMKNWLEFSINKLIENEISDDLGDYLMDVISLFVGGARINIFFMKKDVASYKKTWKILSRHLVERILEDIK